ncbi:hypothetical protein V8E53_011695 [Lactarius tabidus]
MSVVCAPAAQVKPITKDHDFVVNHLEEVRGMHNLSAGCVGKRQATVVPATVQFWLAPDGGSTLVGATEMVAQQVADRASAVAGCLCAARSEAAGEHVRKVSRAAMGSLDKKGKDACWSQLATADGGEEGIETKGSTNATLTDYRSLARRLFPDGLIWLSFSQENGVWPTMCSFMVGITVMSHTLLGGEAQGDEKVWCAELLVLSSWGKGIISDNDGMR